MNLYDVLEVSQEASQEMIKDAYRTLAKKYHPDLYTGSDKSKAEEKMKEINYAFDILGDPIKRRKYDESLRKESFKNYRTNQKAYSSYTWYWNDEANPYYTNRNETSYSSKKTENDESMPFYYKEYIISGILWIIAGLILVCIIYSLKSASKGVRIIFWSTVLWGIINFVRGLIFKIAYEDEIKNGERKYSIPEWFVPSNIVLAIIIMIFFINVYNKDYKSSIAYQIARNNSIAIGMDKETVKKIMGDPDSVESRPALDEEIWKYDDSTITFNNEGVVKEWHNRSNNLSVYMGDKVEGAVFKIGSSKEDVVRAMGTPHYIYTISSSGKEIWGYEYSTVTFDYRGLVIEWDNVSNYLSVYMGDKTEDAVFKIGSSKQDVIRAMGTPDDILRETEPSKEIWKYENSTVTFDSRGLVTEWNDLSDNLAVYMGDKVEGAVFKLGSSKKDVIRAMGTPDSILKSSTQNREIWGYEESTVTFDNKGFVIAWIDVSNNLAIDMGDEDEGAELKFGWDESESD